MKHFFYYNFKILYRINQFGRRFTPAGRLVSACTVASAVLGLNTNLSMTYQIFTFLLMTLAASFLQSCFFNIRFSAKRRVPRFATVSEPFVYEVMIENLSGQLQKGLWLMEDFGDLRPEFEIFRDFTEPGEEQRNPWDRLMGYYGWEWLIARKRIVSIAPVMMPDIPAGGSATIRITASPEYRGVISFDRLILARPDPLGLFFAYAAISLPQTIAVLPRRHILPDIDLPGRRMYHPGGMTLSSSVGDSTEFISMRDYRPGDPMQKIHWRSWAKIGKPVVKEYQAEFFVRHALILDTFQNERYSQTFEDAVSLAASLACTIQTQETLLELMFVDSRFYSFTSGRGLGHPDRVLEILASVSPTRHLPFSILEESVLTRSGSLSGCICIFLTWDNERKALMARLQAMGVPVWVIIVTPPDTDILFKNDDDSTLISPEYVFRFNAGKLYPAVQT
ncbi:MAG: hypothetical protein BWK80_54070 [Desulfobacteraceae bacterium IS3]|nr:MAG: hypothetical protein BWK80_54070 [Desulfobacteraceae bacterium IS3]